MTMVRNPLVNPAIQWMRWTHTHMREGLRKRKAWRRPRKEEKKCNQKKQNERKKTKTFSLLQVKPYTTNKSYIEICHRFRKTLTVSWHQHPRL